MKQQLLLIALLLFTCQNSWANLPGKDSNVVISSSKEYYEFGFNKRTNMVQVNEKLNTVFYCTAYRTTIPVAEFYDDRTSIDNVAIEVDGKKAKDIKPTYEYYSQNDIFYSDAKICYFMLPLEKMGSSSEVTFEKTITDIKYFTSIFLSEPYKISKKELVVKVPRWMKVELKEMNFKGFDIKKSSQYNSSDDADIVTYTITNLPATIRERNSPGPTYIEPHILVLSKFATPYGNSFTYFNTVKEQYDWYRSLVKDLGNDETVLKAKALDITQGISGDIEKIKAIFYWVQNNVRYLAFEDGIAGFKPEKANEVLRKKYGDCKGMAHLTKELLKALNYDARLCWIGTNHIAYDYSTPTLSVDNHMICALNFKGKLYFLDATETYLPLNEYAERIQGRQVLVEDGDKYILTNVPTTTYTQNLDAEKRVLTINGTDLIGTSEHEWKGEEESFLLYQLNNLKKDKSKEAFTKYLNDDNKDYLITNLVTSDINNFDITLTAKYNLTHKKSISAFGKDLYVDVDFRKEMGSFTFDTTERKYDYWFSYKSNILRETELTLPAGFTVSTLPPNVAINNADYEFTITYKQQLGKIFYTKRISIKNPKLAVAKFSQWNSDIAKLNQSYNEQIVLTAK